MYNYKIIELMWTIFSTRINTSCKFTFNVYNCFEIKKCTFNYKRKKVFKIYEQLIVDDKSWNFYWRCKYIKRKLFMNSYNKNVSCFQFLN